MLKQPHAGFTLVELSATVVIIAILATAVSSGVSSLITHNRHVSSTNELRGLFALARSQALTSGQVITVCPLDQNGSCLDDWSRPISVFVDQNRDGQPDSEPLRTSRTPDPSIIRISRTAGRGYFRFTPRGMNSGTLGSLVQCSKASDGSIWMSYLALNIGGRMRIQTQQTPDGSMRLPWGPIIHCPPPIA